MCFCKKIKYSILSDKSKLQNEISLCVDCQIAVQTDSAQVSKVIDEIFKVNLGLPAGAYRALDQLGCIKISVWTLVNIIEKAFFAGEAYASIKKHACKS